MCIFHDLIVVNNKRIPLIIAQFSIRRWTVGKEARMGKDVGFRKLPEYKKLPHVFAIINV